MEEIYKLYLKIKNNKATNEEIIKYNHLKAICCVKENVLIKIFEDKASQKKEVSNI